MEAMNTGRVDFSNNAKDSALRELRRVDARLNANRSETELLRSQWRPLTVRRAAKRGLVPESFWDKSSELAKERSDLLGRQYDLRVAAGLNGLTGLPPEKPRRVRVVQDDKGGGWYPDLLGPTEEVKGWCSGPVTELQPVRWRGGVVLHSHCDDMYRHHLRLEENGVPVVGMTLKAKKPWRGQQSATIDRVFTDAGHRRRGYASSLLDYARREFRRVKHSRDLTDQGRAWRRVVKNPDERMRELERRAAVGDVEAQELLDNARRRSGLPVLGDQLAASNESAARNAELGFNKILFPDVRSWRDLFVDELPTSIENEYRLPAKLAGAGYRPVKAWLDSGAGREMGLAPGGKLGVGDEFFSWSIEVEKPNWAEPWNFTDHVFVRGRTRSVLAQIQIGPYCSVSGPGERWSLYVRASDMVYDAIRANMHPAGVDDSIYFDVKIRGDKEPLTALVSARNNVIIGSRWLAVIPALEVPKP